MPVFPTAKSKTRADKYPSERTFSDSPTSELNSNYWMEWVDAGTLKMAVLPLPSQPTNFTVQASFPTSIEYTLGIRPKREHNYPKQWMVTVSGRIGVKRRHYTDSKVTVYPIEILDKFKRFLEDYQQGATENGAVWLIDDGKQKPGIPTEYRNYNKTTLMFRATKENEHFFVEPVSFTYDRQAASTRQSASWTMVLRAWERDDEQRLPVGYRGYPYHKSGPTSAHTEFVKALDHLTPVMSSAVRTIKDAQLSRVMIDAANKKIALDRDDLVLWLVSEGAKQQAGTGQATLACLSATKLFGWAAAGGAKLKQAQVASLAFAQQAENFRTSVRQATDVLKVPLSIIGNLLAGVDKYASTLQDVVDSTSSAYSSYKALVALMASVRLAQSDTAQMFGQAGGHPSAYSTASLPLMSAGPSGVYTGNSQMIGQPWTVPAGVSSWDQLSQHLYGTTSYGSAIAKLNNAKDATSDSKGKPLSAGDTVLVPADTIVGTSDPDSIMGVDFAVDPASGDLQWEQPAYLVGSGVNLVPVDPGGTDLMLSKGVSNLVQAIRYRAVTRRGAVTSLPGFGLLLAGPGDGMSEMVVAATFAGMRPQLLQDMRVSDVQDQKVVGDTDALLLTFRVIPVGPHSEGIHVVAPLTGA